MARDPKRPPSSTRAEHTVADAREERTVAVTPPERTEPGVELEDPTDERPIADPERTVAQAPEERTVAQATEDRTVADAGLAPPAGSVAPDPVEGELIGGRYRLLESLGKGGAGTVFRAERLEDGAIVAVKVLAAAKVKRARVVQRFFDEVRAASLVEDPGLIKILDFVEEEEPRRLAYAMEYVEGESLRSRIKREGALDLRVAIRIASQISDALSALHDAGIIHRDLKPENILILGAGPTGSPRVKLLDFGVVKFLPVDRTTPSKSESEKPGTFVGTPRYMAPEQAAGTSVDRRADLFALGVVLFEMITGQCPHEGDSLRDVVLAKLKGAPRITVNAEHEILPAELTEVVDACLKLKPTERPESAKKVAGVLNEAELVLFAVGPIKERPGEPKRSAPDRPPTASGTRAPASERVSADLAAPSVGGTPPARPASQVPARATPSTVTPEAKRLPLILIGALVVLLILMVALLWKMSIPDEPALMVPVDPPVTPIRARTSSVP